MNTQALAEVRKSICHCSCDVAFDDPCANCPNKKWHRHFSCKTQPDLPSTGEMATNLARATLAELAQRMTGRKPIPKDVVEKRLAICHSCEFFRPSDERCSKCGCFLKHKTAWRSQKCPVGKW
jgi:hypothetical protein